MAERRHFSKLPDVPGFTRVADEQYAPGRWRRMLRCDACGDVIPSLGVGYHRNGRPCTERKAERLADEEQSYADVTDELNDVDAGLVLADLNPRWVDEARRYAECEQLPWPPNVGDFDRFCERRWERERRAKAAQR